MAARAKNRMGFFSNFGNEPYEEHFCEITLTLGHWPRRRSLLKVFLFLALATIFVQPRGTILAILVEGCWRNTSVQIF